MSQGFGQSVRELYDLITSETNDSIAEEAADREEADEELYQQMMAMPVHEVFRRKINSLMEAVLNRFPKNQAVEYKSLNERVRSSLDEMIDGDSMWWFDKDRSPDDAPLQYNYGTTENPEYHGLPGQSSTIGTTASNSYKRQFYFPEQYVTGEQDKVNYAVGNLIFARDKHFNQYAADSQWNEWECLNGMRPQDCRWRSEYAPIQILEQPQAVSGIPFGDKYTVSVKAKGSNLKYQWQYSTNNGATWNNTNTRRGHYPTLNYTINATIVDPRSGHEYLRRCIITSGAGDIDNVNRVITNTVRVSGQCAKFTLTNCYKKDGIVFCKATQNAKAGGTISYQWQRDRNNGDWGDIPGATTLTLNTAIDDPYATRVRLKAILDSETYQSTLAYAYSDPVTIQASTEFVIIQHPESQTAAVGDTVSMLAAANGGSGDYSYQWRYRSSGGTTWYKCTLEGNKTDTYEFDAIPDRNGYSYRCYITDNVYGTILVTNAATLTVTGGDNDECL